MDDEIEAYLDDLRAAYERVRLKESEALARGETGEASRLRMTYHHMRKHYEAEREATQAKMVFDFVDGEKRRRAEKKAKSERRKLRRARKEARRAKTS
jgi:hypothetical protein